MQSCAVHWPWSKHSPGAQTDELFPSTMKRTTGSSAGVQAQMHVSLQTPNSPHMLLQHLQKLHIDPTSTSHARVRLTWVSTFSAVVLSSSAHTEFCRDSQVLTRRAKSCARGSGPAPPGAG